MGWTYLPQQRDKTSRRALVRTAKMKTNLFSC